MDINNIIIMYTIYERVNCKSFIVFKFNKEVFRIIPTVTELNKLQTLLGVEQIYFPLYLRASYIIEIICVIEFTIELCLRIISAPKYSLILYDVCNFLDLVS